jgi:hypothetical protein
MGINAAHNLADSFDLDVELFQVNTSDPFPIQDALSIFKLNIRKEVKCHWRQAGIFADERTILANLTYNDSPARMKMLRPAVCLVNRIVTRIICDTFASTDTFIIKLHSEWRLEAEKGNLTRRDG